MTDKEVLQLCKSACEAALAYDKAIQSKAPLGKSWVCGEDLDVLYDRWISLSTKALEELRWKT